MIDLQAALLSRAQLKRYTELINSEDERVKERMHDLAERNGDVPVKVLLRDPFCNLYIIRGKTDWNLL